jgi:hypothetical protein
MRISIVTPSFNQASFLEQTLRSVLDQDYPDLEYLVVDGGSTDGSVEIIRRYAGQLAWWVSEKDRGQAEGINKGLARATGEVVAWLNSDDLYQPGAFTAAVQALEAHPECGMVFGDMLALDGEGRLINIQRFGDWGLEDLMQFRIIGQPSVFMRRSVLEKVGFLDLNYHFLLDHQLWLRMAQAAPICHVPQVWSAARFHPAAKNVGQAASFGREAYALAAWMQSQPGLSAPYQRLERRVWAGAHRMNAHYLLDGGQPRPALAAYLKSLWAYPPTALPEWRRILYSAASLVVNVEGLKQRYLQRRQQRVSQEVDEESGHKNP